MIHAIQVGIELVGMVLGPAELAAIVGQHRTDRQVETAIEGRHAVMQHRHASFGSAL